MANNGDVTKPASSNGYVLLFSPSSPYPPSGLFDNDRQLPPPGSCVENSNDEHVIDVEVWYGQDKPPTVKERAPTIPKVPITLRNSQSRKLPQWYRPSVISIGPYYYHFKEERSRDDFPFREAQKRKHAHADKFIQETDQDKDDLYRRIRHKTAELRKCYDQRAIPAAIDDNKLATIFLLDGCFVLHFVNHYRDNQCGPYTLNFTNHEMNHIMQDLFLLENQLPYEVLKVLFKYAKNSDPPISEKIKDFVASHVPFPRGVPVIREVTNPEPSHLLHYLQHVIVGKPPTASAPAKNYHRDQARRERTIWRHSSSKNVQELRKVGIRFKPSPTSYLTDISFSRGSSATGCLKLPAVSMNNSTMIIFLNLIAFESSNITNNNSNRLGVISYLCFLDSLIDRWNDVMELQTAGIIRNFGGDRGDVADFFNNVCNKLVPDSWAYKEVMLEIEDHIERHQSSRLRQWYIECKQKYFSSPWSCMALFAAVIGLSLTAIQAYTSVFSNR